jgi:hypothetical protein
MGPAWMLAATRVPARHGAASDGRLWMPAEIRHGGVQIARQGQFQGATAGEGYSRVDAAARLASARPQAPERHSGAVVVNGSADVVGKTDMLVVACTMCKRAGGGLIERYGRSFPIPTLAHSQAWLISIAEKSRLTDLRLASVESVA